MSMRMSSGRSARASVNPDSASVALSTVSPADCSSNIASSMFVALSSMSNTLAISSDLGVRNEPQLHQRSGQPLPRDRLLHDRRGAEREALAAIGNHRDHDDRNVLEGRDLLEVHEQIPSVHRRQD